MGNRMKFYISSQKYKIRLVREEKNLNPHIFLQYEIVYIIEKRKRSEWHVR